MDILKLIQRLSQGDVGNIVLQIVIIVLACVVIALLFLTIKWLVFFVIEQLKLRQRRKEIREKYRSVKR